MISKKLSIITINFNNQIGLKKTIESVIGQTFNDFEYIVIDGGSTDKSVELIKNYAYKISYWVSEPDKGIYNAINKGIIKAIGEYCLFLNSGDWLHNNKILEQIFNKKPTSDILFGNSIMFDVNNNAYLNKEPENLSFMYFFMRSLCHQAMFIKRDLFEKNRFGLYREDLKIVSDWEFNIRAIILGQCTVLHFPYPIVYMDNTGVSITNRNLSLAERENVFKEIIPEKILNDYNQYILLEEELRKIKRSICFRGVRKFKKVFGIS